MSRAKQVAELLFDLEKNHATMGRPTSIYSRAMDEIRDAHEFIRTIAWRFSEFSNVNWSDADVQAHVADFFGVTVKEMHEAMEKAGIDHE